MTDKHDYTEAGAKHQTRLETLRVVKERCPLLWDRQKKCLARDWMELTAVGDPTLRMLLDAGAVVPGRGIYIGVNGPDPTDPKDTGERAKEILATNEAAYGTDTSRWVYGPLESILAHQKGTENVGVLVADGFYSVGDHNIAATQAPFFRFSQQQTKHIGQFLLVINLVLRGSPGKSEEKALADWLYFLARVTGLPEFPETNLHTYRNKSSGHRMVLTRVLFGN